MIMIYVTNTTGTTTWNSFLLSPSLPEQAFFLPLFSFFSLSFIDKIIQENPNDLVASGPRHTTKHVHGISSASL